MPGTKEIRAKIASVKNTQKITKAMQMVATSKIRRAQERMRASRPYAQKMRNVLGHLTQANPDYRHPFLQEREVKGVGIIVISTDRGLAGALNANVFKQVLLLLREWQDKGAQVSLCIIGTKGLTFFRRLAVPILANVAGLGDRPRIKDLIGAVKVMLDAYREGKLDRLLLVNAQFIYEPDAASVLDQLLMRYIESQVYRGAVETVASEQAARMVAMKAASDNAGELISELQLIYNKARQAAITKELSEIVGGAAAV
jgi:F-type H+-transporting ATPase subunit gamma